MLSSPVLQESCVVGGEASCRMLCEVSPAWCSVLSAARTRVQARALTRAARRRKRSSTTRMPRWWSGRPSSSSSPTVAPSLSAPNFAPSSHFSSHFSSPRFHPPLPMTLAHQRIRRKRDAGAIHTRYTARLPRAHAEAKEVTWQYCNTAILTLLHARPDADKSNEKMQQEKLEREKLNGEKDVAQSNYNTETAAYNQVLPARLVFTLLCACSAGQSRVPESESVPIARAAAGGGASI